MLELRPLSLGSPCYIIRSRLRTEKSSKPPGFLMNHKFHGQEVSVSGVLMALTAYLPSPHTCLPPTSRPCCCPDSFVPIKSYPLTPCSQLQEGIILQGSGRLWEVCLRVEPLYVTITQCGPGACCLVDSRWKDVRKERRKRQCDCVGGLASAAFCPWIKSFGLFPTQEKKCTTLRTQTSAGLKEISLYGLVRGHDWDLTHSNKKRLQTYKEQEL